MIDEIMKNNLKPYEFKLKFLKGVLNNYNPKPLKDNFICICCCPKGTSKKEIINFITNYDKIIDTDRLFAKIFIKAIKKTNIIKRSRKLNKDPYKEEDILRLIGEELIASVTALKLKNEISYKDRKENPESVFTVYMEVERMYEKFKKYQINPILESSNMRKKLEMYVIKFKRNDFYPDYSELIDLKYFFSETEEEFNFNKEYSNEQRTNDMENYIDKFERESFDYEIKPCRLVTSVIPFSHDISIEKMYAKKQQQEVEFLGVYINPSNNKLYSGITVLEKYEIEDIKKLKRFKEVEEVLDIKEKAIYEKINLESNNHFYEELFLNLLKSFLKNNKNKLLLCETRVRKTNLIGSLESLSIFEEVVYSSIIKNRKGRSYLESTNRFDSEPVNLFINKKRCNRFLFDFLSGITNNLIKKIKIPKNNLRIINEKELMLIIDLFGSSYLDYKERILLIRLKNNIIESNYLSDRNEVNNSNIFCTRINILKEIFFIESMRLKFINSPKYYSISDSIITRKIISENETNYLKLNSIKFYESKKLNQINKLYKIINMRKNIKNDSIYFGIKNILKMKDNFQ